MLTENGYALCRGAVSKSGVDWLIDNLPPVPPGMGGSRSAHDAAGLREFATRSIAARLAKEALGEKASVIRLLYFDKQPGSNWKLGWHQDLAIALRARHEVEGYGPWSVKAGIVHAHAPAAVLEQCLAVRTHLDDCGNDNGPLRVIPGTHLGGKLSPNIIEAEAARGIEATLECGRGDAILMRPLLLHASSPAIAPSHRRILHIEYSSANPPRPLEWFFGWPLDPD